jgi:type VI protein secretion system component VasK
MFEWLEHIPWDAITAIATIGIATVGGWQITAIRRQTKGWKTLEICEKHDQDPIIDQALRNLGAKLRRRTA